MMSVFPIFFVLNIASAFTSYQSFLEMGQPIFFLALFVTFGKVYVLAYHHGAAQRAKEPNAILKSS
jgi:hypothetical protein